MFDDFVFVIPYRNQLKASYLMSTETQSGLVEDIAAQVNITCFPYICTCYFTYETFHPQVNLKGSYTSLEETMKHVDSLTKDDIVKV